MLSALGHNPTFAVRRFSGSLEFDPEAANKTAFDLRAEAESLEITDQIKPADRQEIETVMRRDVLQTATYPDIVFLSTATTADRVSDNWFRLRIEGDLSLHGITKHHELDCQLRINPDRARISGDTMLRMSDFRLKKISALAGTITLKEELKFAFDLVAQ
jgi:polyisoprenoid-binding protein YceI